MSIFEPTKEEIIQRYEDQIKKWERDIELVRARIKKLKDDPA
jgi:hypothetical protein